MENNNLITNNSYKLTTEKETKNYTIIEVANKKYAIDSTKVYEIIRLPELDINSLHPSFVLGLLECNETPIPVLDLREIFKTERIVYDLGSQVVVIKTRNETTSIVCDKVFDVSKLEVDKIHTLPYQGERDFFDGMYINNENNYYILNIENLIKYLNQNVENYNNDGNIYIVNDDVSKAELTERKYLLSKMEQHIEKETPLYDMGVSFSIDDIKYYINMASVKEFFKPHNMTITKIPSVPDFIIGLINIKGEYITILDIRKFYSEFSTTMKEKSTIIILNSEEFKIGILADEISESMNINFNEIIQNKLQKQEEGKLLEFVKDGNIYQILDIENLLSDERLAIC